MKGNFFLANDVQDKMNGGAGDLDLVAACRAGNVDAFGVLVRRYQHRLFSTVVRITSSVEDAHDVLQDAYLRAYEKLDLFHGESSFYTWIYRIAVNLALSEKRKTRIGVAPSTSERAVDSLNDPSQPDPSGPIEQRERDDLIQQALNALAPDQRAIIIMKDLDGLRYDEIAAVLRIPVGTVRSRLHRARGELRERLQPVLDELEVHPINT